MFWKTSNIIERKIWHRQVSVTFERYSLYIAGLFKWYTYLAKSPTLFANLEYDKFTDIETKYDRSLNIKIDFKYNVSNSDTELVNTEVECTDFRAEHIDTNSNFDVKCSDTEHSNTEHTDIGESNAGVSDTGYTDTRVSNTGTDIKNSNTGVSNNRHTDTGSSNTRHADADGSNTEDSNTKDSVTETKVQYLDNQAEHIGVDVNTEFIDSDGCTGHSRVG